MDLLTLLALTALAVLPIVFLFGLAGCSLIYNPNNLPDPPDPPIPLPNAPTGLEAKAVAIDRIDLTWTDNASNTTEFKISRDKTNGAASSETVPAAPGNPQTHPDAGLQPGEYTYQVFALAGDVESLGSDTKTVSTLMWKVCFNQGPTATVGINTPMQGGRTVVQRLAAGLFQFVGAKIRITFRAGEFGDLQLNAVFVSSPDPTGKEWDSAAPLKQVFFNGTPAVLIAAGTNRLSDEIDHSLVQMNDLIVACDVGTPGNTRRTEGVTGARGFRLTVTPGEAGETSRSQGYQIDDDTVFIVETIEVLA